MTEAGGEAERVEDGAAGEAPAPDAPPVLRVAPPTRPGAMRMPERKPRWPTGIGVTGIVLSVLGGLSGFWWAISPLYTKWVQSWTGPFGSAQNPMYAAMERMTWTYVSMGVATMLMCAWLLWASVLLLQRKWLGARMMSTWGWAAVGFAVVYAGVTAWMQYQMMNEMSELITQHARGTAARGGTPPPAGLFRSLGVIVAGLAFLFSLLLGEAFPVIALYFVRRKASREHVATWVK